MRYETVRAVVLGSRPLGEADRIVTLLTKELGKVDAVVKGVRRTKSRWGGRLEPFGIVDLVLFRGRSLFTVTSAQLANANLRLREDREAMSAAAVVCEAAAGLFAEGEPEERAFNLVARSLRELDAGFAGPALRAPLLLGAFVKLLCEAGYQPVLDHCASCGAGGDRGFLYPELADAAVHDEAMEVAGRSFEGAYSLAKTCEIVLSDRTGHSFESLAYLVDEATA